MNVKQLILELNRKNIFLSLKNGKLVSKAVPGALTSEIKAKIASHKNELLAFFNSLSLGDEIKAASHGEPLVLSYSQKRMYFLHQAVTHPQMYNEPKALKIRGDLCVDSLTKALHQLVEQHRILRTVYAIKNGEITANVISGCNFIFEQSKRSVQEAIDYHLNTPFDLENDYMLRAELLNIGHFEGNEFLLIVCFHHIAVDGWSYDILIEELLTLYSEFRNGHLIDFPAVDIQFSDYAAWESGLDFRASLDYWRARLAGVSLDQSMPIEISNPVGDRSIAQCITSELPPSLIVKINEFTKKNNITKYVLFQSVFTCLLHKYGAGDTILVGTLVANREMDQLKKMVGLFVNSLIVLTNINGRMKFSEVLRQVEDNTRGDLKHQAIPFDLLVNEFQQDRLGADNSLLKAVMVFHENKPIISQFDGLHLSEYKIESMHAKFNLTLEVNDQNSKVSIIWRYAEVLFEYNLIAGMVEHFNVLLGAVVCDEDLPISKLSLLNAHEQDLIVNKWNHSSFEYTSEMCTHLIFEHQANLYSERIAVFDDSVELSYRELNEMSNRLARHLRGQGVSEKKLVGVYLERSHKILVCILAIFKAGGVYVPLDVNYPQDRLNYIIDDANLSVILTDGDIYQGSNGRSITAINISQSFERYSVDNLPEGELKITYDDLAYVIYTSGSTGNPKGVLVPHGNLCALLTGISRKFQITYQDSIPALASFAFDISLFELLLPILNGGACRIIDDVVKMGMRDLIEHISDCTHLHAVPSLMQEIVRYVKQNNNTDLAKLKRVFVGGDKVSWGLVQELKETFLGVEIVELYGPTEATILSSADIKSVEVTRRSIIGRALPHSRLYVLSQDQELLPVGVIGELYIGGAGVARGYLNRPDLNTEKFLDDIYSGVPNARLYRSGDLVRRLADGNIEFIGRADHQVKIRGFRIELGEVEATLLACSEVKECIVVATADPNNLVAYVVAQSGSVSEELLIESLRGRLSSTLPYYMVPDYFILLDQFPLASNGKVNRKALPSLEYINSREARYQAPSTRTECVLSEIWQNILRIDHVSVIDNFFRLGGHSLLALRLVSEIKSQLKVEIAVSEIFKRQTITALATFIDASAKRSQPKICAAPQSESTYVSFAQQRLWLIDNIEQGSSQYNMLMALQLTGHLDVTALRWTIAQLVNRHEVLRTHFDINSSGSPVAILSKVSQLEIPLTDISSNTADRQHEYLLKLYQTESAKLFNLRTDLMLRAKIIKKGNHSHVLLIVMHHIASDGWSQAILLQDFNEFYNAAVRNLAANVTSIPISYSDFAFWQRSWMNRESLEEDLAFWTNRLRGIPDIHNLPLDRPRPPIQDYTGANFHQTIGSKILGGLNDIAHTGDATLFMVLNCAFAILLSRYSNETDIVIGTPVANRELSELHSIVGLFVNTVVLRCDLASNPTFNTLLSDQKSHILDALEFQRMPFEKLVDELRPERSRSYTPIFQIMLALQNNDATPLDLINIEVDYLEGQTATSKYDLTLNVIERDQELVLTWEYATALFDKTTIVRMAASFECLLQGLIRNPNIPVGRLPLLNDAAIQSIIYDWNNTRTPYARNMSIVELIEGQVEKSPNAVSVIFDNDAITYIELNTWANRVAHRLINHGIKKGMLVGVCVERSIEMVVAILAILKAGAAYVPIDPSYPKERKQRILEKSRVELVVVDKSDSCGVFEEFNILSDLRDLPSYNPCIKASPQELAYVIFTSGSTGEPKGVAIRHESLVNIVEVINRKFKICADDRILCITSIGFDLSVYDIFGALHAGAVLVISKSGDILQPDTLVQLIDTHSISFWNSVPSTLGMVVDYLDSKSGNTCLGSLRLAFLSGDWIPTSLPVKCKKHFPNVNVISLGGATEGTVWSNYFPILGDTEHYNSIPYGRPLGNNTFYVLDKHKMPAPVGVVGELYIGGVGVATGYLNDLERTDIAFVDNPFHKDHYEKMYRTGDLGRLMPDTDGQPDQMEFIGRVDYQVKIRGFRVELGEIESVILKQEKVEDVVVIATTGPVRLVAYVVTPTIDGEDTDAQTACIAAIRDAVKLVLPNYMLPSSYILLPKFPLTANGKIDRNALPEPDRFLCDNQSYVPPVTNMEVQLCGIWQRLLKADKVGLEDNFFELGGHSLLAVRLTMDIRSLFGVEIGVADIFDHQSIKELLPLIQTAKKTNLLKLSVAPSTEPLGLSFAQRRLWIIDRIEGDSIQYNMALALKISGSLNVKALEHALREIIFRHRVLRTHIKQGILDDLTLEVRSEFDFKLNVCRLSNSLSDDCMSEALVYCNKSASKPFDLSYDLMVRAELLEVGVDAHVLLLTMHHIAFDGWSMALFIKEFQHLYRDFVEGNKVSLAPLPFQYSDYVYWQKNILNVESMDAHLTYWQNKLAGLPVVHSLPLDFPRGSDQNFSGDTFTTHISSELTQNLLFLCQDAGATLFMGLHAVFSVILARYSHDRDIVIGTPVANREITELVELIGLFVNTLVLRCDLSGKQNFLDLLNQCRNISLEALANQHVPFENLVEALHPERSLSHSPLFQIMLILQNNEQAELDIPGLEFSPFPLKNTTSKFDLTLNVKNADGGLELAWEYNDKLFKRETVTRIATSFSTLLLAVTEQPTKSVFSHNILSAMDQHEQCVLWNSTDLSVQSELMVHQIFEGQVQKYVNKNAIIFGEKSLTYGDLNASANRLANYLVRQKAVKPDSLIGICLDRSTEMLVSLLAVLKSGAAYVPMDPDYPEPRLRHMMEDADLCYIVTTSIISDRLNFSAEDVICLDNCDVQKALSGESFENPDVSTQVLSERHLAYVIYTSGSTGMPKGVMVEHRNVVNFLAAMASSLVITSSDTLLAVTSISFDIHVLELFLPLFNGAGIVLSSNTEVCSNGAFDRLLHQYPISIMQATPVVWRMLAESVSCVTRPLKVISGGEVLGNSLAGQLLQSEQVELWNVYGPTETTVWSCCKKIECAKASITMGRPIGNTSIYVLEPESFQLCPVGVVGELFIGGSGVTRGYLGKPEATAEKYVSNPYFNSDRAFDDRRLYRTGDLVRRLSNGEVEFCGRADFQVKIRGFRIELGEIESHILTMSSVSDVVVTAHPQANGEHLLVAYFVSSASMVDPENARKHLRQYLPQYMIPALFVQLEKLPLTPNGKIDRKALPVPSVNSDAYHYTAPQGETEKALCAIWSKLLNISPIGVDQNFFTLGGDSIKVLKMINSAADMGIHLMPVEVFRHPTVRELAAVKSDGILKREMKLPLVGELALTASQQWFFNVMKVAPQWGEISSYVRLEQLDLVVLEKAIRSVCLQHDALRATFVFEQGQWRQYLAHPDNLTVNLHYVDLSNEEAAGRLTAIGRHLKASQGKLDLSQAPLMRTDVFFCGITQGYQMRIMLHHLLVDRYSLDIIFDDLMRAYQQLLQVDEVTLASVSTPINDWMAALSNFANSSRMAEELDYWRRLPWESAGNIPMDFPENAHLDNVASEDIKTSRLPKSYTQQLQSGLANVGGVSFVNILIAAMASSLVELMEEDRVVLKVIDAARDILEEANLSRSVGWLATFRTLLINGQPAEGSSLTLLEDIDRQIQAVPLKGLGFDLLRYYHKDEAVRGELSQCATAELILNFYGEIDVEHNPLSSEILNTVSQQQLDRAGYPLPIYSPENLREVPFFCNAAIENGELVLTLIYSHNTFKGGTIQNILDRVNKKLMDYSVLLQAPSPALLRG